MNSVTKARLLHFFLVVWLVFPSLQDMKQTPVLTTALVKRKTLEGSPNKSPEISPLVTASPSMGTCIRASISLSLSVLLFLEDKRQGKKKEILEMPSLLPWLSRGEEEEEETESGEEE